MKLFPCYALLLIAVIISSCKDSKNHVIETVEVSKEKVIHESASLEAEFKDPKVAEVYKAYNTLKTALVNTDNAAAAIAASQLMTAYANLGVDESIFKNASAITEDTRIASQREAFERVTAHVETMLEDALVSGTIYKQFCPMAFNNKGAYWLSNTKEIRNPYFGDMMLKCGRVDKTLK